MQAASGLAQLQKLPQFIQTRISNFKFLREALSSLSEFLILPEATPKSIPAWFGFPITIRKGAPFSKNDLVNFLAAKKIDTRPLFAGNITRQPYFMNKNYRSASLENTDIIMNNSFWIGVYPALTEEMLRYVKDQFVQFTKTFQ
jgi:CDP-6-deoxy-D-xylo-4-hexulose-3-dehydrase